MTQAFNVILLVFITFLLSIGATFFTIFIDKILDTHTLVKSIPRISEYNYWIQNIYYDLNGQFKI